jgi:hypothetical protein
VEVALADGVKSVPEAAELVVLRRATQLVTDRVFPLLLIVAGSVNVRFTLAFACPWIENEAALDEVTATDAVRPGKTLPKARSLVFVTVMGCCTSAVTLALAEFCACRDDVVTTDTRTNAPRERAERKRNTREDSGRSPLKHRAVRQCR